MASIGIDLGTTNSLVAVVLDGSARVLLNDEGEAHPLCGALSRGRTGGCGSWGYGVRGRACCSTITSVKRFMDAL